MALLEDQKLVELQKKYPAFIVDVRGTGLMLGAELASDAHGRDIVNMCLEKGVIINCTVGKGLRFLPPLIITEDNINDVLNAVELVLTEKGL